MLTTITALFNGLRNSAESRPQLSDHDLNLVSAALMTEVMVADGAVGEAEMAALQKILAEEFRFDREEVLSFIEIAREKVENATSLFEFTDIVNRHFSDQEKFTLVECLWRVAYADGVVHKLEEATIRKVSELIYLPHSSFIRAKQTSR